MFKIELAEDFLVYVHTLILHLHDTYIYMHLHLHIHYTALTHVLINSSHCTYTCIRHAYIYLQHTLHVQYTTQDIKVLTDGK